MLKSITLSLLAATVATALWSAASLANTQTSMPKPTAPKQVCKEQCVPSIQCPPGKDLLSGVKCPVVMSCKMYCRAA